MDKETLLELLQSFGYDCFSVEQSVRYSDMEWYYGMRYNHNIISIWANFTTGKAVVMDDQMNEMPMTLGEAIAFVAGEANTIYTPGPIEFVW